MSRNWGQAKKQDSLLQLPLFADLGIGEKDTQERLLPQNLRGSVTDSRSCEQVCPRGFELGELEQGSLRAWRGAIRQEGDSVEDKG